jgi:hypothetical protein
MAGLTLALSAAPAWAGRGAGPAAERPAGLLAQARAWIGEVLAVAGIVPSGRFTAAWGEDGAAIGPNGLQVASPPGCAAGGEGCPGESADGDDSGLIDPNG